MHEVQAPRLVETLNTLAGCAIFRRLAAARSPSAEDQPFFAVQTIDQVTAAAPTLAPEHNVHPAIAIADARLRDLMHAQTHRRARIAYARLALGRACLACVKAQARRS